LRSFTRTKQPHEANRGHDLAADGGAFFPETPEATEEWRTPCAGGQQATKQDDSIDTDTALARPVGLRVEVEPESELVEGEGCADTIADAHQAAEEDGNRGVLAAKIEKPSVADEEQDQDSPDEVVDVTAADHDPMKGADVSGDEADEYSHAEKGDQESEGGDKKAAARAVWNGGPYEEADVCEM